MLFKTQTGCNLSVEHKQFWKMSMEVNEGQWCLVSNVLQNVFFLCFAEERKSNTFRMTRGQINLLILINFFVPGPHRPAVWWALVRPVWPVQHHLGNWWDGRWLFSGAARARPVSGRWWAGPGCSAWWGRSLPPRASRETLQRAPSGLESDCTPDLRRENYILLYRITINITDYIDQILTDVLSTTSINVGFIQSEFSSYEVSWFISEQKSGDGKRAIHAGSIASVRQGFFRLLFEQQ